MFPETFGWGYALYGFTERSCTQHLRCRRLRLEQGGGVFTATKDAHDRYANQEIAFLLQRIETFDGIAILASNFRDNADSAFMRRFESVIYFPMPRPEERLRLWQQGFPPQAELEPGLYVENIAQEHAVSGGLIMNVIRYASLQALKGGDGLITRNDILQGIRKEYAKEGKGG